MSQPGGNHDPIAMLAEALGREAPLKLWSVLVTCLGDVSQDRTAEVSGLVLSALVERIGLQPQAMRVALHRLKRDGWVDSRRRGRVGFHSLSGVAVAQARAIAPRIYGPALADATCHLVGLPPDAPDSLSTLPPDVSAVPVSRSFVLMTGSLEGVSEDWLIAAPAARPWPLWVTETLSEAACDRAFADLAHDLEGVMVPDDPLDCFVMRVLVLHGWRRLILRSNAAAEVALGASRAEVGCRAAVHRLLDDLGPLDPDSALAGNQSEASA